MWIAAVWQMHVGMHIMMYNNALEYSIYIHFLSSKILIAIEKRVDTNILKAPEACTRRYIADECYCCNTTDSLASNVWAVVCVFMFVCWMFHVSMLHVLCYAAANNTWLVLLIQLCMEQNIYSSLLLLHLIQLILICIIFALHTPVTMPPCYLIAF